MLNNIFNTNLSLPILFVISIIIFLNYNKLLILNENFIIKISISLLFIIIIIFISIKNTNEKKKMDSKNIKIILYYSSDKEICLKFIDTIWKQIIDKYRNINFVEIDVYKNKKYSDIYFNELPKIYMINENQNIVSPYINYLDFNNIENFLVKSQEIINSSS